MSSVCPIYRFVVLLIVLLSPASLAAAQSIEKLAAADKAHDVLRKHCAVCHSGAKPRASLDVFKPLSLVSEDHQVIKSGKPDESELLQLVECGTMPPGTRPKVSEEERKILRQWIEAGAPAFPPDYSEQHALTKILLDIRQPGRNLADERYITLNHLVADEKADLKLYRAALHKALNQLSTGPTLVAIEPIDANATIYRIRLSELGWDVKPFGPPKNLSKEIDPTTVNLYDLLLLDYPLASLPEDNELGNYIIEEYLAKVKLLRPIPYLRGDWLVSVATQAPLYNDLLRLPLTFPDLERRLGLGDGQEIKKLQETVSSAVVKDNRHVERRSTDKNFYWRAKDDASLSDAAIFRLPNGLPGYFLGDAHGVRLETMPPGILRNPSKDGTRNGLSCMVCHDRGLMTLKNSVKLADWLDKDNKGFLQAFTQLGPTEVDPIRYVSQRFRQEMARQNDEPKPIIQVNHDDSPRRPLVWYAKVFPDQELPFRMSARQPPILALDAIGVSPVDMKEADVSFDLKTVNLPLAARNAVTGAVTAPLDLLMIDLATRRTETKFQPGDKMAIAVKNTGKNPMYFELILEDEKGNMKIIPIGGLGKPPMKLLLPNAEYRFPPQRGISIQWKEGELAKQRVIVYAAAEPFPAGVELNQPKDSDSAYSVGGRVVHPFYEIKENKIGGGFNPAKMVKKTIEYETVQKKADKP